MSEFTSETFKDFNTRQFVLVDDAELCCLIRKAMTEVVAIYQKTDAEITALEISEKVNFFNNLSSN